MLNRNKCNIQFIFFEIKDKVIVYKSVNNKIKQITEFILSELFFSIELLKRNYPEISKSKNTWLLNSRIENIEKAPLSKVEMYEYAKWKIQEVIDVPLENIYYDILLNNINNNFYKKYATAVIVEKSHIDFILNCFLKVKIKLHFIDCLETAILDFFKRNQSQLNEKVLTFLNIEEDSAKMGVYLNGGLIFNRIIELPILKEYIHLQKEIDQDVYKSILDKLSLEIQRNIDYLDRKYGIQNFENILCSIPKDSILNNLAEDISQYFNVKNINIENELIYKSESGHQIPIEILLSFERGDNKDEQINLIPKIEKNTGFNEDFKKMLVIALLFGIGISAIGSYYEVKVKKLQEEIENLTVEYNHLEEEIENLKKEIIPVNNNLEKEIERLTRNKNELIKMKSSDISILSQSYNKIMKDIAIKATSSGVILEHIKYNEKGLLLKGYSLEKEMFTNFISNLQKADTLIGKSLNLISMEENQGKFIFTISSENMSSK